ncbi:MAG: D-TA family PLP-dependent enzyme, partial [Flavisolibacter sp.]|nr:D-TA family PLP-dependent enzyme [Flavisolibacter sp.]
MNHNTITGSNIIWYQIDDLDEIDSPAFVIFPERVKENIRIAKSMAGDTRWLRPHVKTHKTKEATLLMIEEGIYKFKCATIAEAEMLAQCKAADVLLAYQPVGPKLKRLIQLIKKYPETKFSCLVDNPASAKELSGAAISAGIRLYVYIDLNVGMNRTGIAPGTEALQLYLACLQLPGIELVGLHVYDGHIHDAELDVRKKRCEESFARVIKLKEAIKENTDKEPVIVAGGTPTFPIHSKRGGVECSPGTFIYWDRGYEMAYPEQPFLTAALIVTRVISLPDEVRLCLDAGHKSVASENELHRRIH